MLRRFEVQFLKEAFDYLQSLDKKHSSKILFNIRRARQEHDPELFKKLTNEIWEFRTHYQGLQYRFLAFWDKTQPAETLVILTHGFVKKQWKIPDKEIIRAEMMRQKYFRNRLKNLKK